MNKLLRTLSSVVVIGAAALVAQGQPAPKIFVVDMAKLYEGHYKTEENNAKLRGDEQKAQVELEKLNKEGNALVVDYTALVEKAKNNPLASNEAKAKAEGEAQVKLEEIEKKKQEIQAFRNNVQNQLGQRLRTFREVLLDEIGKTATELAKRKGATIVIDRSGPSGFGISNFIYLDPAYDMTDEVMKEINKDRPPASAAAASKAGAPASAPAAGDAPTVTFPGAKKP